MIPQNERYFANMPQELWQAVLQDLPSFTGSKAAEVLDFKLHDRERKHSDIWKHVFRDEKWCLIVKRQGLNPILVGDDLHKLYDDPQQSAYIALLTGDNTRNIRHEKSKLLASLKPHDLNEKNEIVFRDSRIVLNIEEPLNNPFFVSLSPKKLFASQHNEPRSASLYWKDSENLLRAIGPSDIVGLGKGPFVLQDVSVLCCITLTYPKEMSLRRQFCFQDSDSPAANLLCPSGYCSKGNILGWKGEDGPKL